MTEDIASAARRIVELGEAVPPVPYRCEAWLAPELGRFLKALADNGVALASAYLLAVEILQGFLACPEIADCAPEDKDPETDALERRARRLITGEQSHG